jgi:glycosyltransferase involved in cell wall biosynthesis
VGGIPEVITSEVGQLVPPADPEALAAAIQMVLEDPARWRQMSLAARKRAEERCLTWTEVAARLIEIYRNVLD